MPTTYLLIDFENVQPKNLALVHDRTVKVLVFRGSKQASIPFDVVKEMQKLGARGLYIDCEGGKNAADFHLCHYLGRLVQEDPTGYFNILSKDKGFDPLIAHLKSDKLKVFRQEDIADIPIFKITSPLADQVALVRTNLDGRGASRPRKVATLKSTVETLLKAVEGATPDKVVKALEKGGYIQITETKITYPKAR